MLVDFAYGSSAKAALFIPWGWGAGMVMLDQWMNSLPHCLHTFGWDPVVVSMGGNGGEREVAAILSPLQSGRYHGVPLKFSKRYFELTWETSSGATR